MNVYLSDEAENQLEEIATYLGEHWSQRIKTDFLARVSNKLELISYMPELYRKSEKRPGLRECVVNKHTVLYYKMMDDEIQIVAILSSRRNPDGP